MFLSPSFRAQLITRRTYNRPLDEEGTRFETWNQTTQRVAQHQTWLWERAQGHALSPEQQKEIQQLWNLLILRQASVSGRTLWLGGTDIAKTRESSQFNCSFTPVQTVYDVVDGYWLLLQGCGVGFEPVPGVLSGFAKPVEIEVKRSLNKIRGFEYNLEQHYTENGERVVVITVGDSAEAWAKAAGKLMALKRPFDRLILDFGEVRKAGQRLRGYGWVSSGDETIHKAFVGIARILSARAGQLLNRIDILDVMNWLGTTLSSRRSAEIALVPWGDPEAETFASAKKDWWVDNPQRAQSNNTLMFFDRPGHNELSHIFGLMMDAGGSEPGFYNAQQAKVRAPWFRGTNPCGEILLGAKSFCNLVEIDLAKFNGFPSHMLLDAVRLVARANYRQTCVELKDGVLSDSWHELNEYLRLCGVGITGIVRWDHADNPEAYRALRQAAHEGAHSMADELGLPRSKAVTTIKPSGTLSKIMDTTEGAHKPLGKYIFNNVNFSMHDPILQELATAGYRMFPNPVDSTSVIVTLPVKWDDVDFDVVEKNGKEMHVNLESAVDQLERYKLLMDNYVDHNCSITVSYDPEEVPLITRWLSDNWDSYVGVSWLYRADPTKTAEDLGYLYLPQEVVTEETYEAYASSLKPVDIERDTGDMLVDEGCSTGGCPIR